MSNEDKVKKSKYLRDGSEPESKYFKNKSPKAQIEKTDEEEPPQKKEYRKNVITPKRAREQMLEEERRAEEELKAQEAAEEPEEDVLPEQAEEEIQTEGEEPKGDLSEIFDKEAREETPRKKRTTDYRKNLKTVRIVLCMAALTAIAFLLKLGEIEIPFFKGFLTVDFSTLPELIASIAYGPLFGVAICVVKNLVHIMFRPESALSDFTNIILDSIFVFIAGFIYSRSMFGGDKKVSVPKNSKHKDYRRIRILKSSFLGILVSLVPQLYITRYIAYPLLETVFGSERISLDKILERYTEGYAALKAFLPDGISVFMPEIKSLTDAILIVNLPLTIAKLIVVTLITALIYNWISPFLHYRTKKKKK